MFEEASLNKRRFFYVLLGVVGVMFVVLITTITIGVIANLGGTEDNGGGGVPVNGGLTGFFAKFTGYAPDETGDIYYLGGNVGIGTAQPNYLLEIDGSLDARTISINGVPIGTGGGLWSSGSSGDIFYTGGAVGVGTNNPTYDLEVAGNIEAEAISINGVPVGTSSDSYWNQEGNNIYYSTGNVGLGIALPQARLHVSGDSLLNGYVVVSSCGGQGQAGIKVDDGSYIYDDNCNDGGHILKIDSEGPVVIQSKIGNVGIGVESPTAKLDVGGSLKTSGTLTVGDLNTGIGAGTSLCMDANGALCECGKCLMPSNP